MGRYDGRYFLKVFLVVGPREIGGFLFLNFLDDSILTRTGRRPRARARGFVAERSLFFYGVTFLLIRVYPYGFCITLSYN